MGKKLWTRWIFPMIRHQPLSTLHCTDTILGVVVKLSRSVQRVWYLIYWSIFLCHLRQCVAWLTGTYRRWYLVSCISCVSPMVMCCLAYRYLPSVAKMSRDPVYFRAGCLCSKTKRSDRAENRGVGTSSSRACRKPMYHLICWRRRCRRRHGVSCASYFR